MENHLTLDVAVSTLGADGILRTAEMSLPRVDGVRYVISWQTDGVEIPVPDALVRDDVRIHRLDGRGLSRNRNNALEHTDADIVLIADDDLKYTGDQIRSLIDTFAAHKDLDFASFRFDGANNKRYPDTEFDLSEPLPKGYNASAIELAMTRRVIDSGVRYDTRFGLGTSLAAGEDELMLQTLRLKGFKGRFFPLTITRHEGLSTGFRQITDPRVARAMGAIIGMLHPWSGTLRLPLKALRMHRSGQMPLMSALLQLTAGWIRQFFMKRPWQK